MKYRVTLMIRHRDENGEHSIWHDLGWFEANEQGAVETGVFMAREIPAHLELIGCPLEEWPDE